MGIVLTVKVSAHGSALQTKKIPFQNQAQKNLPKVSGKKPGHSAPDWCNNRCRHAILWDLFPLLISADKT
jgi:hypothetical protein